MNFDRYIKNKIVGPTHSFLFKTPSGFKDEVKAEIDASLSMLGLSASVSVVERGAAVESLKISEALKLAMLIKGASDVLILAGSYKSAHESDLSKIDYIKLSALLGGAKQIACVLRGYSRVSTPDFHTKLQNKISENGLSLTISSKESKYDTYLESVYENGKHSIYLSLTGFGLNQRGFKEALYAKAPIREDLAYNLIEYGFKCFEKIYTPETILVPFLGSATFIYEYALYKSGSPNLNYESWFVSNTAYSQVKSLAHFSKDREFKCSSKFIGIDIDSKAIESARKNHQKFSELYGDIDIELKLEDVLSTLPTLKEAFKAYNGKLYLPLNPPWGERLGGKELAQKLYKGALKLICALKDADITGFLLCPNEQLWSFSSNYLTREGFKLHTKHFTQGGKHLRALYFKK